MDFNRVNLAVEAGVTSTLVSYYFPDKVSLIISVAKPLVDAYLARLKVISINVTDRTTLLRTVVLFLLEIRRDNGELLDRYIDYVKQHPELPLSYFLAESSSILHECLIRIGGSVDNGGHVQSHFLQTALWGMCTAVAQSESLAELIAGPGRTREEVAERQADLIIELLFTKDRA